MELQPILDALPVGLQMYQLNPDGQIVCRLANNTYERMFEMRRHAALGLPSETLLASSAGTKAVQQLRACFETGQALGFDWQYRDAPHDRHFHVEFNPIAWRNGQVLQVLASFTDRTREKAADRQRLHLETHDALTGLPNRVLFADRVEQALAHSAIEADTETALLILNVDRFKLINESMGHISGDELLIAIGRRLMTCVRPSDTVARLSSDEFAVLMRDINDLDEALSVAARIHREMGAAFVVSNQELFTSISIGIATTRTSGIDADNLLRDADFAMHQAKTRGGAHTEVYHNDLHRRARSLFRLENDLRKAVDRNELELHYQPLMDLQTGVLMGFEALARWKHAERGYVSPAEFIPLAEETGLIIPIGRWAIEEACRQLAEWRTWFGPAANHLFMGVNVSGIQFTRDNLAKVVTDAIARSGIPGDRLKLEITESALVENPDLANQVLRELKDLNVSLALDDFGTGYSSLSYLQRFPIDVLKIDRSFITDMLSVQDNYKIVNVILALARNLGKSTVAEGIESEEQAETLRALGCQQGQGFHFSKGLSAPDCTEFVRTAFLPN
ncbi:MAG TPA: EAL domain-containing protein [Pedomonas sp.]|uniref:putative bifunctional diguanylate cyclase/phosphodiesterase n=1 Tax=Pedomonas sp. TaxID=2976421 RepID=UPI002F418EE4